MNDFGCWMVDGCHVCVYSLYTAMISFPNTDVLTIQIDEPGSFEELQAYIEVSIDEAKNWQLHR